jgi:hypothetical protein
MRRNLAEILFPEARREGFYPGDEAAHRAAQALADRFDAATIIAVTDALSFTSRVGGQLLITTLRTRLDSSGRPVGEDEPGEYRTVGVSLEYESRDAKVTEIKRPELVFRVPVTDTADPPTVIETPADQRDPEDGGLRDEIEAEVAADAD